MTGQKRLPIGFLSGLDGRHVLLQSLHNPWVIQGRGAIVRIEVHGLSPSSKGGTPVVAGAGYSSFSRSLLRARTGCYRGRHPIRARKSERLKEGGSEAPLEMAIDVITKRWLQQHSIPHDKLIIERELVHTVDPSILVKNRFAIAASRAIRIFVEDDLFKAKKLASICEIVFLFDHPYNSAEMSELPNNIVRVSSWFEIYQYMRQHL
jgi:hypothetical protein